VALYGNEHALGLDFSQCNPNADCTGACCDQSGNFKRIPPAFERWSRTKWVPGQNARLVPGPKAKYCVCAGSGNYGTEYAGKLAYKTDFAETPHADDRYYWDCHK
jgi:hypothetical protein